MLKQLTVANSCNSNIDPPFNCMFNSHHATQHMQLHIRTHTRTRARGTPTCLFVAKTNVANIKARGVLTRAQLNAPTESFRIVWNYCKTLKNKKKN